MKQWYDWLEQWVDTRNVIIGVVVPLIFLIVGGIWWGLGAFILGGVLNSTR